jgi:TonB family protein
MTAFSALFKFLATTSVWWWPRFADHLWQTTLFALIMLAASFALRRGSANWRHTFCLLASAKFIVPAALFVFLAQQSGLESFLRAGRLKTQSAELLSRISEPAATLVSTYDVTVVTTGPTRQQPIYLVLTAVWLAVSFAILLLWAIRRRRFLRSLRLGRRVRRGREWRALKQAQETLRIKRNVGLVMSPLKIEPGLWRVWRPVIVLPESMANLLDDDELEAIMLHEMIHIERRDNLIGHFQLGLCALLWFHPLVWFLSRKLFDEREQACDERVMQVCGAPEAYASSILKVVRFCFGWRTAGAIGAASGNNLRRRIENIMSNGNANRRAGRASRMLAASLAGLALFFIVCAGFYSRPYAVSAVAAEKSSLASSASEWYATSVTQPDGTQTSKRIKIVSPPPPPAEPVIAEPPAPPSASTLPTVHLGPTRSTPPAPPLQPSQPATPPTPPTEEQAEKPDKHKPPKDKPREKTEKGELIEAPPPVYPEEAKKQKIEGTVVVTITIGNDGNVIYAKAKSGPEALYVAAETAASRARFKPATINGKPAKVAAAMTYNFVLDKK